MRMNVLLGHGCWCYNRESVGVSPDDDMQGAVYGHVKQVAG